MFDSVLEQLGCALEARRIDYMVIGGQAVLVYGEPRLTKDIDLTIARDAAAARELLEIVRSMGWKALPENPETFVSETMVLPCQDPKSGVRIDLIFTTSDYERQAIARARRIQIGKALVQIASPEDIIVHKVLAGRPRDLEDVRGILAKNSNLDLQYVRRWLKDFDQELAMALLQRFEDIMNSGKG
jgi:predicted nucleotidyltransferase